MELHREGSAPAACAAGLFSWNCCFGCGLNTCLELLLFNTDFLELLQGKKFEGKSWLIVEYITQLFHIPSLLLLLNSAMHIADSRTDTNLKRLRDLSKKKLFIFKVA